eukprot:scaffold3531_cov279-Prasinococcus_capsulatus_cf.AAC.4
MSREVVRVMDASRGNAAPPRVRKGCSYRCTLTLPSLATTLEMSSREDMSSTPSLKVFTWKFVP